MNNILKNLKNFFPADVLNWFFQDGLKILIILVGVFVLNKILKTFIEKLIRRIIIPDRYSSKEEEKKREDTLIEIANHTIGIILIIIAGIMILQSLGVPVAPVLATAGIAGLAFGFGGQYLIRDIITGLFIILENQYRVGDTICSNGICGSVENISLRMTTLRDLDGTVHHIPHGEIKIVSNLSKNYSRINLNIDISYDSDIEKVIKVINKVGDELAQDSVWKSIITKPPHFLRVNNFNESSIEIKILGETLPGKQWEVAGELRLRIKIAFDRENIEMPFPQRVIHQSKN